MMEYFPIRKNFIEKCLTEQIWIAQQVWDLQQQNYILYLQSFEIPESWTTKT